MSSTASNPTSLAPAVRASSAAENPAWKVWVPIAVIGVAFLALFFRFFAKQGQHSWGALDDWGHSFVIPLISGFMLWKQRPALAAANFRPFWPGVAPLVLGIWCYFFFVVGVSNHMFQGASMVLALAGLTMLVFGLDVFRIAFLPIAYLLFGITISEQVMIKITFELQVLATHGGWLLLKIISLPGNWFLVEQAGNTLEVTYKGRSIPLNVAEACSGMRMVIAFIALAGAVAIFSCKHWWQRVAVVALAVPVALIMNVIRVAVLAIGSIYDANLAAGNAHMLIGTLLLIPGLFLFMGTVWCLERMVVEPGDEAKAASKSSAKGAK
jgi:exosortase